MARVAYLKEPLYHDIWFGSGKFVDVYDNKDGFGGETALCVQLKDGATGYIPLTENSIRGGRIKTIGTDGKQYSLAVQRKKVYEDIAYCKMTIFNTGNKYTTIGNNFIQITMSSIKDNETCSMRAEFYDVNGNNLTNYKKYIEDDVNLSFSINAYLTFSGYGNGYNFRYDAEEMLGTIGSYTNKDVTINTKFNNSKSSEDTFFSIGISTPNTGNSGVNRITFKNITLNGRNIPIRLS